MTTVVSFPGERSPQAMRLRQFIIFDIPASIGGMIFILVVYLIFRLSWLLPILLITTLNTGVLFVALRLVNRNELARPIIMICATLWFIVITMVYIVPQIFPGLVMLVIWPVAIAVPYLSRRSLRRLMIISSVVAAIVAFLSLRPDTFGVARDLPTLLIAGTNIVLASVFTALTLLQLWQYSGRLNDTLEQMQATNEALQESERFLEVKVIERTQELEERNEVLATTLQQLKSTQRQLVEAEKMAALGGLVAGVAHEINTPVGVGVTAASLLEEKTSAFRKTYKSGQMKRSDLEKYLDLAGQTSQMILSNLQRAAELIQSFKQVAVDQSSEERRPFAVKAYLDEILLSLHPKLKRTQLAVEIHAADSLTLDSYPGAFAQIVTNLVMNSLIHAYEPDAPGRLVFELKQEDGRFIFEYADDGRGIPKENLSKIFDPFFTTRRGQGGSGLGLHIIYNLVTQKLGGAIRCESQVGVGTRFIIELPLEGERKNDK